MSVLWFRLSLQFSAHFVQKFTKYTLFLMSLPLALATTTLVYADLGEDWSNTCVAGLENTGGRGSNAASAYCGCMAKAAGQFNGEPAGLLAVMQAPVAQKTAVYNTQNIINKRIISVCAAKIEEAFGVTETRTSATGKSQLKGFWADPEVIEAIRLINLEPAQAKVFRAAATEYSIDLRLATAKIFRDKLDIKRKLKKKQRVLAKRMDEKVMAELDSNQIEPYEALRKLLDNKVKSLGRRKPGANASESGSED